MGADIHMYVEGRKHVNGSEKWISGDYFSINPYYDGVDKGEKEYKIAPIYDDRNYRLFALLADVRNNTDITPISEPRGLPVDSCEVIFKEHEYWGSDAHSASFFTLTELEEYANKGIKTKYSGFVHESEIEKTERGENPSSWCQGTNQPNHVHVKWEVEENILEPIIKELRKRSMALFHCYSDEQVEDFSSKIRIVFWFDN